MLVAEHMSVALVPNFPRDEELEEVHDGRPIPQFGPPVFDGKCRPWLDVKSVKAKPIFDESPKVKGEPAIDKEVRNRFVIIMRRGHNPQYG